MQEGQLVFESEGQGHSAMANLLRQLGRRNVFLARQTVFTQKGVQPLGAMMASSKADDIAYQEMKEFWAKNRRLERPLSPHLRIYKMELPMMTSLAHRVTGIVMAVAVPMAAAGLLFVPYDFTAIVAMIHNANINHALITAAKYIMAFPVCYHFLNGIRHLAYDWALGFTIKQTYLTGYTVMALSLLVTAIFVHLW